MSAPGTRHRPPFSPSFCSIGTILPPDLRAPRAGARSGGQGWPVFGPPRQRRAASLTAASTTATSTRTGRRRSLYFREGDPRTPSGKHTSQVKRRRAVYARVLTAANTCIARTASPSSSTPSRAGPIRFSRARWWMVRHHARQRSRGALRGRLRDGGQVYGKQRRRYCWEAWQMANAMVGVSCCICI